MVSKFHDVERAVAYLCECVRDHFPSSHHLDVSWYPHGTDRKRCLTSDMTLLGTTVGRMCRNFQEAAVICDPEKDEPAAVGIQCRYRDRVVSHQERPTVVVMACPNGDTPSAVARDAALNWLQTMIHEYQVDERKRKHSNSKHHIRMQPPGAGPA
jgi:hypothetical protein